MASPRARPYKDRRNNEDEAVDRISELPDEIIHRILALVPSIETVRLSLLSRRWRHVWHSVPSLHFSGTHYMFKTVLFDKFIQEWLNRRTEDLQCFDSDCTVTSFVVENVSLSPSVVDSLTRLLSSPKTINKIKDLSLFLYRTSLGFPVELLSSTTLSTLNFANSSRLLDDSICSVKVNLPSLTSIFLWNVSMSDQGLGHILSGCPSLERLELIGCLGLNRPKISSSSLENLEFSTNCKNIHIEAANLQSAALRCGNHAGFDISSCVAVRKLELCDCAVEDQLWRDIETEFTLLESLELRECSTAEEITISSRSLTTFVLFKADDVKLKTNFNTPKLVSFYYWGDLKFALPMKSPNDELNGEIEIRMNSPSVNESFYLLFLLFMMNLNWSCNNMLALNVTSDELNLKANLFMKDSNGHPIWPGPEHMKVDHCKIQSGESEFTLECFLRVLKKDWCIGTPILNALYTIFCIGTPKE